MVYCFGINANVIFALELFLVTIPYRDSTEDRLAKGQFFYKWSSGRRRLEIKKFLKRRTCALYYIEHGYIVRPYVSLFAYPSVSLSK